MIQNFYIFILPIYAVVCFLFPELNIVLYLLIGRIALESRLSFFDYYSMNHINLFILVLHFVLMIKNGRNHLSFNLSEINLYFMFFAWAAINYFFLGRDIEYGMDKLLVSVFVTLLSSVFILYRIQILGYKTLKYLLIAFTLVGIGMALLGFGAMATGEAHRRLAVLGGGPIVFARIIGMTNIILMVNYNKLKAKFGSSLLLFFIILLFITQLSTLSKGPLISILLIIMIIFFGYQKKYKTVTKILMVSVIVAGVIGLIFLLNLSDRYFLNPTADISYGSYGTRLAHIKNSISAFMDSPFFGIGLGNFRYYGEGFEYPHNLILETMSELGGIGLLILLLILLDFLSQFLNHFKDVKNNIDESALITKTFYLLALFMLTNQMFSGDLMDSRYAIFFMIVSTAYYKILTKERIG